MQRANNLKRKRNYGDDGDGDGLGITVRQILPVASHLPVDFDGEPTDGAEYLFTVRRSAATLPWLAVAKPAPDAVNIAPAPWVARAKEVQRRTTSSNQVDAPDSTAEPPSPHVPSEEWRDLFVARFRSLRQNVQQTTIHVGRTPAARYPKISDRGMWWSFVNGRDDPPADKKPVQGNGKKQAASHDNTGKPNMGQMLDYASVDGAESSSGLDPAAPTRNGSDTARTPTPPSIATLQSFEQKHILHLLMYFSFWINQLLNPPDAGSPSYSSEPAVSPVYSQWIFALLAYLDDRLLSGEIHTLRTLARACGEVLRRSYKTEDEVRVAYEDERESCWMVLAIIGGVWGQSDLWEETKEATAARTGSLAAQTQSS